MYPAENVLNDNLFFPYGKKALTNVSVYFFTLEKRENRETKILSELRLTIATQIKIAYSNV